MIAKPRTPPTTPPAIAPTFVEDLPPPPLLPPAAVLPVDVAEVKEEVGEPFPLPVEDVAELELDGGAFELEGVRVGDVAVEDVGDEGGEVGEVVVPPPVCELTEATEATDKVLRASIDDTDWTDWRDDGGESTFRLLRWKNEVLTRTEI